MKYEKPPLSYEAQADLLIQRGMGGDRDLMISRLAAVNYYRLSGYWYPFRKNDDTFHEGTTFERVWCRYAFDRRLRLLVMDAIERLEVAVRSQLAYRHAHAHGAFAYVANPLALPKFGREEHRVFCEKVQEEISRSKDAFVAHFRGKYGDAHSDLPVWMAIEVLSFGTVLSFYRGCSHQIKQAVASMFGMPFVVFDSWLLTLSAIRNACAHHGRLWNREFGVKPIIPRIGDYPDWHTPVKVDNRRIFAVLTICAHGLHCVAPQSQWAHRLQALFAEFPAIPTADMGFPKNWTECPIWEKVLHGG